MREDVANPAVLGQLTAAEADLNAAVAAKDVEVIEKRCESVNRAMALVMPPRSHPTLRENLEVLVVAFAVAMAFRCYFLQPFKIPTGSMQPTLYGIHYSPQDQKGFFELGPLRIVKWLATGEWYTEITAQAAGTFRGPYSSVPTGDGCAIDNYDINGTVHAIPRGMPLVVSNGNEVVTGQVIARGNKVNGDHLFVNRVKWNFLRPSRGEVMVFRTDGIPIPRLTEKTHYIKRMCGLPNEVISIREPRLLVDGIPPLDGEGVLFNALLAPGYAGYCGGGNDALFIKRDGDSIQLGNGQYLALGDNTHNSLDGRYWGPVPAENLVGPAMVVYWPFSSRWGWIH